MIFPGGRRGAGLALMLLATSVAAVGCASAQAASTASASAQHLSAQDIGWLDHTHQANEAEVQAGQLAESNAGTATIRSTGAMMVRDHSALDAKLVALATRLHVTLPQSPTVGQVKFGDELSSQLGLAFDNNYVGGMLTAHEVMIRATQAEIAHGTSPPVVALARQALPVLEKHLRMLKTAAASL